MKVTKATAYALHALMYMVRHFTQLPVTTDTIAKGEGIPPGYLAKIFQRLTKARLVRGVKGRKRGHVFANKSTLSQRRERSQKGTRFCQAAGRNQPA